MKAHLRAFLWLACLLLAACSNSDDNHDNQTLAQRAQVAFVGTAPGVTPFIRTVTIGMSSYADLASVSYTIAPKPGTFSKPVAVTFDKGWLDRKNAYDSADQRLTLPVFGLYANYSNDVTLTILFSDGSRHAERMPISTPPFDQQAALYDKPTVNVPRTSAPAPGLDFIFAHNFVTTPVVIDSDGNLRWVGAGIRDSAVSMFTGDSFLAGSGNTPDLYRMEMDGTFTAYRVNHPTMKQFHHDLAPGKTGVLAEIDTVENGVQKIESNLVEITPTGEVIKQWDMAQIFRDYMRANGDDPARFVVDGVDWFHMNSAIYSSADDSLYVSSRENFVVKLDYATGRIKWLLGDTTKHWYRDYPSLRALALQVVQGNPPIGQHALEILADGGLLLFNNGTASLNQPPGTSPGATLPFSAPVKYTIDEQARTAAVSWTYEHDRNIVSEFCSSVRQGEPGNYIITYSMADKRTKARLIAVDTAGNVEYDLEYPSPPCNVSFLSSPIDFGALTLK